MEELLESKYLYHGRILNLRVDTVRVPSGDSTIREVVEHPGAVVIVAVDSNGDVPMVRQYRHAVGRDLLELPAGTLEKDELPEAAAPRELKEETGYTAERWELVARFFSSPGILTEKMYLYLAQNLTRGTFTPMEDEDLHLELVPLHQAIEMARSGDLVDAKSMIGLLLAGQKLTKIM